MAPIVGPVPGVTEPVASTVEQLRARVLTQGEAWVPDGVVLYRCGQGKCETGQRPDGVWPEGIAVPQELLGDSVPGFEDEGVVITGQDGARLLELALASELSAVRQAAGPRCGTVRPCEPPKLDTALVPFTLSMPGGGPVAVFGRPAFPDE